MKLFCVLVFTSVSVQLFGQGIESRFESPSDWLKSFLITSEGDTIRGTVQHRDFSFWSNDLTKPKGVKFKAANGIEQKFTASELNEIYVMSAGGNQQYLSLGENNKTIYKVVVDGPCKLLYNAREVIQTSAAMGPPSTFAQVTEKYSVYYKGSLSKALTQSEYYEIPVFFRKNCSEIFADCPEIAEQVKNQKYKSNKLFDIVTDFNKCLSGK